MVFYHTVGSELILDGFICGGNYAAGNEKYTKWPTLYGDASPPQSLSATPPFARTTLILERSEGTWGS